MQWNSGVTREYKKVRICQNKACHLSTHRMNLYTNLPSYQQSRPHRCPPDDRLGVGAAPCTEQNPTREQRQD